MSIRKKIMLVLIAVITLHSFVNYVVERFVVLPQFESLQQKDAVEDLDGCINLINNEVRCLSRLTWDWSNWDDAFKFAQDRNQEFINSNLPIETFEGNGLNLIYICDTRGDVIWGQIYDSHSHEQIELSQFPSASLSREHVLLKHSSENSVIQGVMLTDAGPMLVSSRPILSSNHEGPSSGTLIMGTILDQNVVNRIYENYSSNVEVRPFTQNEINTWSQNKLSHLPRQRPYSIEKLDENRILASGVIYGIDGKPSLLVNDYIPAVITDKAKMTLIFAWISTLDAGIIILLTMYWLQKKLVLSRLADISETVDRVTKTGDYSIRTNITGKDELTSLGNNLNRMLEYISVTEKQIIKAKQEWERTFDAVPDLIAIIDQNYKIVRINKAMAAKLDITPAQAVGCNCYELIHETNSPPAYCLHHKDLTDNKQQVSEIYVKKLGGYFSLSLSPFFDSDDNMGYSVHIARDINERIINEKKLLEDKKHAEYLAHEASMASLVKSQFVSNISHEIRTPLNAIIGFSDLLADENLTDEQQNNVSIIRESAAHLLELISDILDFSKIEANNLDINITEYSVDKLCKTVESMMRPRAKEKGLAFDIHRGEMIPEIIKTDPTRVKQCLINLVGNSIKFTPKGSINIDLHLEYVNEKSYLCFDIIDTGIGIAREKQNTIFEAFMQADASSTRRYDGTGLGLTITRRIAELLDGDVKLKSEIGKGSVFSLIIPTNLDAKSLRTYRTGAGNFKHNDNTTDDNAENNTFIGRVLIAEDTRSNALLLKRLLEQKGLEVVVVTDGEKAIEITQKENFNIIFMDMQMPNMDGYETTRFLRKNGLKTPIVAHTAHAMTGEKEKCLSAGCDDYISKPINREALMDILHKYLPQQEEVLPKRINSLTAETTELGRLCSQNSRDIPISSDTDESISTFDIINWDDIVTRIPEHAIEEIFSTFIDDTRNRLDELTEAVGSSNIEQIISIAHSIKGSAANISAEQLSQAAAGLEQTAKNNDLSSAAESLQKINEQFEKLEYVFSKPKWFEEARQYFNKKTLSQNT